MAEKIVFEGITYTNDKRTGYYLGSRKHPLTGKRERLHRAVWMHHYGPIPEGHEVHHKDENKDNNDIYNFELLVGYNHRSVHGQSETFKKRQRRHVDRIRHLTKAWHSSEEGRDWHRENGRITIENMEVVKKECEQCGNSYDVKKIRETDSRFCSNKCKAAWRREQGLDDEDRTCLICGTTFRINKYSKNKTCSRKCGWEMRRR
ncbi:MAG: HNH endonuclease signature motif containing protein [Pseudothermotoga sp.]